MRNWLAYSMRAFNVSAMDVRLVFVGTGGGMSLIYWFEREGDFVIEGNVVEDVYGSGVAELYEGAKIGAFRMDEVRSDLNVRNIYNVVTT